MPTKTVEFWFMTGLSRSIFRNARLRGSWDAAGRYSDQWTDSPMLQHIGPDGARPSKAPSNSISRTWARLSSGA